MAVMSSIDYQSSKNIQNIIRNLLRFEGLSERGDSVATSILMDIRCSLGVYGGKYFDILTPKQRQVIFEVLVNDKPQCEVAKELGLTQQGVSYLVNNGVKRIQEFLSTGKIAYRPLTDDEKAFILNNYKTMDIVELASKLQRTENNCRVIYFNLMNGGG